MLSVEAEADKTLRDLHNSSYDTRAELVLTLETSEMSAIFVSTTKTTQPRPQVFSVNAALTCMNAAFLTSFPRKTQILPNLVISNWLW